MEFLPYENLIKLAFIMHKIADVEKNSHGVDRAYLGWQHVRLGGVPLDSTKNRITANTGFEGYFIGKARSQEELLVELLKIGQDAWSRVKRINKFDYKRIKDLQMTILGDTCCSVDSAVAWAAELGSQIARLRMNLINNPQALHFQSNTRQVTADLPLIEYTVFDESSIKQKYLLPKKNADSIVLKCNGLTEEQNFYWQVVSNIGKFGHPLVRSALRTLYR